MKLAIMQPYFLPYIGYFQLMNHVDKFVVYDNIEFTKKGWINRNRMLVNGKDVYFSVPLKKDSDYLDVRERFLSEIWIDERNKLLNRIKESYRKAPYFESAFLVAKECILSEEKNLFSFILNSLNVVKKYLDIKTSLVISSDIEIDHNLKSEQKVIAICKGLKADHYINPIGGLTLYGSKNFLEAGVSLSFIKTTEVTYPQFSHDFVPFLSILDVMMFNSKEQIQEFLNNKFVLLEGHYEV